MMASVERIRLPREYLVAKRRVTKMQEGETNQLKDFIDEHKVNKVIEKLSTYKNSIQLKDTRHDPKFYMFDQLHK